MIALLALAATSYSAWTSHASLELSQHAQQTALFTDFQGEYTQIASRFPIRFLEADFRPPRGSDDYKRLQDYWIFCYAEWFATTKFGPDTFRVLWDGYYAGLVTDALEIPSLRYVLIDMVREQKTGRRDMHDFFAELTALAAKAGMPFAPASQAAGSPGLP